MNLTTVKAAATSKVARQILKGQKHSPKILFVAGMVGVAGTVVLACRATMKLEEVLDEHEKREVECTTRRQEAKNLTRTTVEVVRLYTPTVVVGLASVAALTGSHIIITKRNIALTAAYKTVDEAFRTYGQRVIDDVGEDKDKEYRYGLQTVDDSDTKKGVVKTRRIVGPDGMSQYARLFDETNQNWDSNPEYRLMFLRSKQNYCNDLLYTRGHVFLNDVFDELGMERKAQGAVVGWVKGNGDSYVDFGLFDDRDADKFYDFVMDPDGGVWLDFNVDGVVWDLI